MLRYQNLTMLKQYGLMAAVIVFVINYLIVVLMSIPAVTRIQHAQETSYDNLNKNARWVAGTAPCNPRIALCH